MLRRNCKGMENLLSRRQVLGTAATVLASSLTSTRVHAAAKSPPVLVELFTSQGCSSCPPADRLAGKLRAEGKVEIISLNVDYWDYLGWRDTLATKEFTQRQYDYAKARGDGQVYTPQMIVNGHRHVVGSQSGSVNEAIAAAEHPQVPLEIAIDDAAVKVTIPSGTPDGETTLWLMGVAPEVTVDIERGENAGSTNTYHSVVRSLLPAGMWKAAGDTFSMPRKAVLLPGVTKVLAVLQKNYVGPVIGLQRTLLKTS